MNSPSTLSPPKQKLYELLIAEKHREKQRISPVTDSSTDHPLSSAQERMWFLYSLEAGSPAYHIFKALHVHGPLNLDALKFAITNIVNRHSVLRTTYRETNGCLAQHIQEIKEEEIFAITDLSSHERKDAQDLVDRLISSHSQVSFDLEHGPIICFRILRLGPLEHVVLFVVHHIAFDGWSMNLLFREMNSLYLAFLEGKTHSELIVPEIQYVDYAHWQQESLESQRFRQHHAYWMQELIDAPTRLDLESVRDCSKAGSDGGVFRQDLPVALSSSVNQFAAKHGLTTFMMYLATLNTLLYRYTGRTDFIVGTPTANRGRSEIQDLIGMFVNTIALRADLSNEPTVEEMLKRTRRTVLAAYEHQEYPFEKVVQAVTPERSAGKHPLFDILLVLQNGMTNRLDIPECHISPLDSPKQKPQFDLVFTIAEGVETNTLWIEYDSDRFDSEYIRRFGVHYIHLLEQMVNRLNLQKQLSKLELLSNQEREELKSWNGPCMPLPTASIPSIILEQAKRTAEAVAATYLCTTITYKDLIDRALRRASQLEALGVTRGTAVGLCGERSLELIEGLLAILFAGGAYVPLDPAYPKQRLASIIEDASISTILLTASHLQELLPRFNGTLLPLMKEPSTDRLTTNGTCRTPGMSDPMYVIFTSGSTGRPKGVINSHIGVLNRLHWMARAYPGLATGKVLQKTSFAFDVSVWELFLPLMYGGTIVFAKPGGQADPEYLADLIQAQSINSVHFVPSMLRAFLNVPLIGRKCDSLTRIICSGEELPKDLMLECIRTISAELHNLYGPTEAAVDVTSWHCTEKWEGRRIPIGHPIDNTTIYIISRSGSLVPAGVPGELLIGGANVALGYINQPELTAERFTVDYLSDKAEGRLYHTGDTAGWDFDGNLIFFGRQDQQVKIRGNRIELEEIVTASKALSIVTDAVAVVDGGTSPRILLYVVSSESIYDEQMLRAHLRSYLPTFMLPAKIIRIDSIPLTVNQKLDHARLAQVANMNSPPPEEAPGDRIGKALHEIWCRLLRREDVMGDSSFFDLGGHSLLLLQLKREIAEHLACNVPLGDFFLFPTLASLAAHVQQLSSTES